MLEMDDVPQYVTIRGINSSQSGPHRLAWIPLPVLFVAEIGLWFKDIQAPHESAWPLIGLNLLLATLPGLVIAFLFARSFLVTGAPGVLLFGCGALIWSASGLSPLAASLASAPWLNVNAYVAIHEVTVWGASLCYLGGAALLQQRHRPLPHPRRALAAAYALALAVAALIVWMGLKEWTPVFFVQGKGGSEERQFVLGSAIVTILLTLLLVQGGPRRRPSAFLDWFILALLLLVTGYAGQMLESNSGGILSWVSRAAQFLGGAYMLAAAYAMFSGSKAPFEVPAQSQEEAPHRYGVAIAIVLTAAVLRLVFLQGLETRAAFITFYPAVMLAAFYGGLRAGTLATILSAALAHYFWIEPAASFIVAHRTDWLALGVFVTNCLLISWIVERLKQAQSRVHRGELDRRTELERTAAARTEELRLAKKEAELTKEQERRKREELEIVLKAIPAAVFIAEDPACTRMTANPAAQAILRIPENANASQSAPEGAPQDFEVFYGGRPLKPDELPVQRAAATGKAMELAEFELRFVEGDSKHLLGNALPLFDGKGEVRGAVGAFLDITGRKLAEAELRRSEALLKSATDNAGVGLAMLDPGRRYLFANRPYSTILGLGSGDIAGKGPAELLAAVYRDQISPRLDRAFAGERVTYELIRPGEAGEQHYYTVVYEPLLTDQGQAANVIVVVYDITAPKLAELRIAQSEERLRFVAERAEAGYWHWEIEPDRLEWSPLCKQLFGIPPGEPMSHARFLAALHPEDRERTDLAVRSCLESGRSYDIEYRTLLPNGTVRWIHAKGNATFEQGRAVRMAGIALDITRRKKAEAALRESKQRLEGLVQSAMDAIIAIDERQRIVLFNPAAEKMFGCPASEALGSSIDRFIPKPFRQAHREHVRMFGETGAASRQMCAFGSYSGLRQNGEAFPVEGSISQLQAGREKLFTVILRDTTQRKRAEEATARLAAIVTSSSDAIVSKSLDGTVTSWNEGAARLFGYRAEEMIGQPIRRLIPAARQSKENLILARIASGEEVKPYETVRLHKDGEPIDVAVTVSPIRDASGAVIGVSKIVRDITERKRHEEHAELLMREVNHRAKNMLAVVQSVARQTAATNPDDFIARFGHRIQALSASQDLLVQNKWKGVDMAALVQSQLAHFQDLIGARIELRGAPLSVSASAAQTIGMALHELSTNAGKYGALSNGEGRLEIGWGLERSEGAEQAFVMSWREQGGPPVKPPARRGFGSTVIQRIVSKSLDAEVDLDFAAEGLSWRLRCPAKEVVEGDAPGSS